MTICDSLFLLFLISLLFWRVGCHRQCPSCCFQPLMEVGPIFSKAQSHPHTAAGLPRHLSGTVLSSSTALGASTLSTTADWNSLLPLPMVLLSSFHREKVQSASWQLGTSVIQLFWVGWFVFVLKPQLFSCWTHSYSPRSQVGFKYSHLFMKKHWPLSITGPVMTSAIMPHFLI